MILPVFKSVWSVILPDMTSFFFWTLFLFNAGNPEFFNFHFWFLGKFYEKIIDKPIANCSQTSLKVYIIKAVKKNLTQKINLQVFSRKEAFTFNVYSISTKQHNNVFLPYFPYKLPGHQSYPSDGKTKRTCSICWWA